MPVMRAQTSLSTSQPLLEIQRCKTKYRKNINQKILKTQIQISFEIPITSNIDIRFAIDILKILRIQHMKS